MSQPATEDTLAALAPQQRGAVEAAAVLESFDADALAALLETRTDEALTYLHNLDLSLTKDGLYQLPPALKAAALDALEAQPQRMRELNGRAERYFAARLAAAGQQARPALESSYMRHSEQLCEAVMQQEPTALATVTGAAPLDLLAAPRNRHLLRYYRGLGAGLLEHFDQARGAFDALLAEHDLDDVVRARTLNSDATFARIQGDYE